MTVMDFFSSPVFPSLIGLFISFLVFGFSVFIGSRIVGIRQGYLKAFGVSFVVMLFSLIQSIIFLNAFFLSLILGAIALVAISKVYGLQPQQALYVLIVSVIVYIAVNAVLTPVIIGSLFY